MQTLSEINLADESATRGLGARLAAMLRAGDVLALEGDLGAGKTTFARGLIQTLLGAEEPVPSPTFTLVQAYQTPETGLTIWHFDLYRLSHPDELVELGWEDALTDGVALVEWPERAGEALPESALWVELSEQGDGRTVRLIGNSEWQQRLDNWTGQ
jgi:tRNA threonylcarbamoyl adenosine modification protein YjeE